MYTCFITRYSLQQAEEVHNVLRTDFVPVSSQSVCVQKKPTFCFNSEPNSWTGAAVRSLLTLRQGLDNVQEAEQEPLDFILAQSADGRHRAAAHGGTTPLQLEHRTTQKQKLCEMLDVGDVSAGNLSQRLWTDMAPLQLDKQMKESGR